MKKLKKNGGFTLVEMLIVVAIIAILIAVSIPLVGSALENARDSTDQANERAAKAAAAMVYLGAATPTVYGESETVDGIKYPTVNGIKYPLNVGCFYYDAENGRMNYAMPLNHQDMTGQSKNGIPFPRTYKFRWACADIKPYGKCTGCDQEPYSNHADHNNGVITVRIDEDGSITMAWYNRVNGNFMNFV